MNEVDTVKARIDRARSQQNSQHLIKFWQALDIVEGMTWAKKDAQVIEYINANVRQSPSRDAVINLLQSVIFNDKK